MIPPLLIVTGRHGLAVYRTMGNRRIEKIEEVAADGPAPGFSETLATADYFSNENSSTAVLETPAAKTDQDRQAIRSLRRSLASILERERPGHWGFAAPPDINRRILDKLDARHLASWLVNLRVDLTNSSPEEILKAFR